MKKIRLLLIIAFIIFFQKTTFSQVCSVSVSFIMYPDNNTPHLWYALLNASGGTPPYNYIIDWGDGSFPTGFEWSHTYNTPGYYNICITISDMNGCTANYCDASTYIYKTDAEIITVNIVNQLPTNIIKTDKISISFSPNPATSTLTIEHSTVNGQQSTVEIYNTQGQLVYNSFVPRPSSPAPFTIDISSLSTGVYFLSVFNDEEQVNREFIKQ